MREILFRGKSVLNGEWLFGNFLKTDDGVFIIQNFDPFGGLAKYEVDHNAFCQYTGLTDKNGRKIFEGDIVKTSQYGVDDGKGHNFAGFDKFYVEFSDGSFCLKNKWRRFNLRPQRDFEVCGNIFDNTELVENNA